MTVCKEQLSVRRNHYADACLVRLTQVVPTGCDVTILAHRDFFDHKLFAFLDKLGFGSVTRFRGNIHVIDVAWQSRPAADWVAKVGRASKCVRLGSPPPSAIDLIFGR